LKLNEDIIFVYRESKALKKVYCGLFWFISKFLALVAPYISVKVNSKWPENNSFVYRESKALKQVYLGLF
jgi:hypothetical protein